MSNSRIAATLLFFAALGLVIYRFRDGAARGAALATPPSVARPMTAPARAAPSAPGNELSRPARVAEPVAASPQPHGATAAISPPPMDPVDPVERNALERERTIRRYATLYRQLGLSGEKADRLTQLLMDDREAGVDFAAASARYGKDVGQDHEAFVGSVSELRAKIQAEIHALLGEEGYAAFQAADVEIRQASIVERLQARLTPINAGLSEAQAGQMLAVLREAGVYNLNDAVVAQAGTFLSQPQVEILTEIKNRQRQGPKKDKIQQAVRDNLAPDAPPAPGK
jgi:hypothetical protein